MVRKVKLTVAETYARKHGKNVEEVLDSYAKAGVILVDDRNVAEYEEKVGRAFNEMKEKTAQAAEYKKKFEEKEKELASVVEEAKKTSIDYDSKIARQAEEIAAMRRQLEEKDKIVTDLQKQVEAMNKDLAEKTEQLQRTEEELNNNQSYITELTEKITSFVSMPDIGRLYEMDSMLSGKPEAPKAEETKPAGPPEAKEIKAEEPEEHVPTAPAYPAEGLSEKPGAVPAEQPNYQKVETAEGEFQDMSAEELEKKFDNCIPLKGHRSIIEELGYETDGIVKDGVFYTNDGNIAKAVEEEIKERNRRKKKEESRQMKKYMDMGKAYAAVKNGKKIEKGYIASLKRGQGRLLRDEQPEGVRQHNEDDKEVQGRGLVVLLHRFFRLFDRAACRSEAGGDEAAGGAEDAQGNR